MRKLYVTSVLLFVATLSFGQVKSTHKPSVNRATKVLADTTVQVTYPERDKTGVSTFYVVKDKPVSKEEYMRYMEEQERLKQQPASTKP